MKDTKIEWCDHTFNPWWGCEKVSAGCANCYAETWALRTGKDVWGRKAGRLFFDVPHWKQVLRWNEVAREEGLRHRVFCASMADVFEDRPDLVRPRQMLWALILLTPALEWLLLTKRPENVARLYPGPEDWEWMNAAAKVLQPKDPQQVAPLDVEHTFGYTWPPGNMVLGTSIENQAVVRERGYTLAHTPARRRFLSIEPLLEDINLGPLLRDEGDKFHQIIVGGESGWNARPCHLEWLRAVVVQAKFFKVPVFVKQLGARPTQDPGLEPGSPLYCYLPLADTKGGNMHEWPEDLRVREAMRG